MNIGKLDQRIRFEVQGTATDPLYGPQPGTWTEVDTVYANVQDVLPSKAESTGGGIRIALRPARVRVRYREDITSAMRIVLVSRSNRVLQIVTPPVELGNKEGLEMMAQEFSTQGDAA